MKMIVITRGGTEKIWLYGEIRNGVLWQGTTILINSDLVPPGKKNWVITQVGSGKITPEIERMALKIGDNGNGLIVRWADDDIPRAKVAYETKI